MRENTFPGGGERRGGMGEPVFCSLAECTTSLSHRCFFFFTTSLSSFHIVSCADILFSQAVSFLAPREKKKKSPLLLRSPLRRHADISLRGEDVKK